MQAGTPLSLDRRGSSIVETDEGFEITAPLPGIAAEELVVEIFEGVLTLKAERPAESAGKFLRRVLLPYDVEPGAVHAQFESGVLRIHIPQRPARGRPQKIPLRSSH